METAAPINIFKQFLIFRPVFGGFLGRFFARNVSLIYIKADNHFSPSSDFIVFKFDAPFRRSWGLSQFLSYQIQDEGCAIIPLLQKNSILSPSLQPSWGKCLSILKVIILTARKDVQAVYSGNGVPERSLNSHPQGWSRLDNLETQSGSTPDRRSSAKHLTIGKHETAVGYDSNGVLSDMLSTDAQHLAFQKFGRTAGFDSLPLLKAIVVNVGNPQDLFKTKASLAARKDGHFFANHRIFKRTIAPRHDSTLNIKN